MLEIERKFLVDRIKWTAANSQFDSQQLTQGYLSTNLTSTVRVRVSPTMSWLTVKGSTTDITRSEFEYIIPHEDGLELLQLCQQPLLVKIRHWVSFESHLWTVDEFKGLNQGLLLAEIELNTPDEEFTLPDWITEEVSHDPRYYNSYLVSSKV